MTFNNDKKLCLQKADKSKKGSIDKEIKPLIDIINSSPDYYTTSSCAGRITLLELSKNGKKHEAKWLLISHNTVTMQQIKQALQQQYKKTVWLKEESSIIHINCRTIEDATSLLHFFQENGFKRSGITSIKNKIMLEIMSTESMDVPVAENNTQLIDDTYLKHCIALANQKLKTTKKRIKDITKKLISFLAQPSLEL